MLRVGESGLKRLQHLSHIALEHRVRIEPESGEDAAAEDGVFADCESFVASFVQHEPVNGLIPDPPYDVLTHSVPAIRIQLVMQIIAGCAR